MRIMVMMSLLIILISLPLFGRPGPEWVETSKIQSQLRLMETWIEAQMAYRGIPGVSVGIVVDQDLIFARGFGYADPDHQIKASPQTLYRIASITKTFTAIGIMQLRDRGKLDLNDPVTRYLPWFKIQNPFPDSIPITIWHLLTHTSGLPSEAAFPYWTDHVFPTQDQIIRTVRNQSLIYPTGTRFKYSNLGLTLAGMILETVSRQTYQSYVQSQILDPLGMSHTFVNLKESDKSLLAVGYSHRLPNGKREIMPFTDSKGLTPAANISSTVEDLAIYVSLQFRDEPVGGRQILKGSTLKEMQRIHWIRPSWSRGRGIGFETWPIDGRTVVGHSGWVAGYRTRLAFMPDHKIAVIVLTNSDDGEPEYMADQILRQMTDPILEAVKKPAAVITASPLWNRYLGRYIDPWGYITDVILHNGELMLNEISYPPQDQPTANLVDLTPINDTLFRMTGENGNGELLTFQMDSTGAVKQIKTGENYIYPYKTQP
ncbi:MAG: serine hydrolase [Candidatus Delongbacteria bacterium]|nr:serine hydrolase [Candidatus Delongbacteria bacterium]